MLIKLFSISLRANGALQTFSNGEVSSFNSSYDPYAGGQYLHMSNPVQFMPHLSQHSQIRMGQQPNQRFNQGNLVVNRGVHTAYNSGGFNLEGPHSPGNSSFNHGPFWGNELNS